MTGTALTSIAKPLGNISRTVLSFFGSQYSPIADRYLDFRLKMASVETMAKSLAHQIDNYNKVEVVLLEKWAKAKTDITRASIQRDIEYIQGLREQFKTAQLSTSFVEKYQSYSREDIGRKKETTESWIDVFNEFARKKNEPWRQAALAKALAFEAVHPGFIRPRAIWILGTIDYELFLSLQEFLSFCTQIDRSFIFPSTDEEDYYKKQSFITQGKHKAIGNLVYALGEFNLVGSEVINVSVLANTPTKISFGDESVLVVSKKEIRIMGMLCKQIVDDLIPVVELSPQEFGRHKYHDVLTYLRAEGCEIHGNSSANV